MVECRSPCFAAFSHFTYNYTGGNLIVTDLQGKGFLLSDPAIHTVSVDD